MRRFLRILLNGLTVLSLARAIGVAVLWVRSYRPVRVAHASYRADEWAGGRITQTAGWRAGDAPA